MKIINLIFVTSILLFWAGAGFAQMAEQVQIHGFGSWAYGKTDNENHYLVGNEDGQYEYLDFSLNISARPNKKLRLYIQAAYNEGSYEEAVKLDYAFAEWVFFKALSFRIGKIKTPFMLYTEVYDVGTIRPFFMLPQGVYHDLTAEAYKGVGITGILQPVSGWEIQYDLYGGKLELLSSETYAEIPNPLNGEPMPMFVLYKPFGEDMFGGRLTFFTPVSGLDFCLSAYSGDFVVTYNGVTFEDDELNNRYSFIAASVGYISDRVWARGEYLRQTENEKVDVKPSYVEAAYKVDEHWQVAARYEYEDLEFKFIPASTKHRDSALGINYWFNPDLVLKLSYHHVQGNRFAFPEDPAVYGQRESTNSFEEPTNLILFGAQFSF